MTIFQPIIIQSSRLQLSQYQMADADEVFGCISPAVTKFMQWEAPQSLAEYKAQREKRLQEKDENDFSFVIRRCDTMECLGIIGLENAYEHSPELGVWLKEAAHGNGYGREAVRAIAEWASKTLNKKSFIYPVATQNTASRRIAETLRGEIIESRTNPKYNSVIYKISLEG
jgi:RimJ/RimL family protein N-acetyltransferase